MGTDISFVLEYKEKSDDKWIGTIEPISYIDFYDKKMETIENFIPHASSLSAVHFEPRIPILFYILCGRFTGNLAFYTRKHSDAIVLPNTIAPEPRGMPIDASIHSFFYLMVDNPHNVKHSYVNLDEILSYKWHKEKVNIPGYEFHENTLVREPVNKHDFLEYIKVLKRVFEGKDARLVFAFDQ